jgi:hypothetical protein
LTELHGGSFVIDSEKGKGTRVVVSLPPSRVVKEETFELRAVAADSHTTERQPLPAG